MLISYRDSRRYPSDPLALQTWVRIAELAARQVVRSPRGFDPLQFARALDLCRRLTCRNGPEALQRMVVTCAAAGVAVVVVPNFDRCHVFSASKWLTCGSRERRAMIALSIRYRRDDQLYFSLFREAGAILAADREFRHGDTEPQRPTCEDQACLRDEAGLERLSPAQRVVQRFSPDRFAREFIIPPEHDEELSALTAFIDRAKGITAFAAKLGIAPGLVVGRMQHDGLISWKELNHLKRQVDLTWVLRTADAAEETWPDQTAATRAVMKDMNLEEAAARERLRRAAAAGKLPTNGRPRRAMRFDPAALTAWRLLARDRDLDAEDEEERDAA